MKNDDVSIFVSAIKPIRNLHVTYRGRVYTIKEGVSTVKELSDRFERLNNNLGNMGNHVNPKGIVWKGQVLRMDDDLSKAGIKNGDRVMILPGDKDTHPIDILGVYLFLLSSNEKAIEETIARIKKESPESVEAWKDMIQTFREGFNHVDRKYVANFLRSAFDMSYHRLRSWWEHPMLRQGLHDPERIENYRHVFSTNLSPSFLKKISQGQQLKKIIDSPELFRREFSKFATKAIRLGDAILEGILDLLLDVLKGRGSSSRSNKYLSAAQLDSESRDSTESANTITNVMEDPSLANNLLFELSESEEDSDLDEL